MMLHFPMDIRLGRRQDLIQRVDDVRRVGEHPVDASSHVHQPFYVGDPRVVQVNEVRR